MANRANFIRAFRMLELLVALGAAILVVVAIVKSGVTSRDIPRGTPFAFIPAAYLCMAIIKLWRREKLRTFLKRADDLRMRQKRTDNRIPFRSSR